MRGKVSILWRLVTLAGAFLITSAVAIAQSGTGQIVGNVTDQSGAVIPGATVTATRQQAGSITTQTDNNGNYLFVNLIPGKYSVTIEAPNFKKVTLTDILVEVGSVVTRDVVLEPGEITDEIVVTAADQPAIEIGKGPSVGDVVDARRVLDLPLNGRNPLDLIQIQSGVVYNNVSGTRTTSNNIRVDGIQAQDNFIQENINTSFIATTADDVAEFRVTTSPVDAEFGRGGGAQVDVVTRSGTNEFHGAVWEFHRNTVFNANTFFNNAIPRRADGSEVAPRDVLLRNQYGFRLGGPIFKNKTFFFGLYEGFRESTGTSITRTVLTATARRGIFRYFPNVPNGNITSVAPTVDNVGNPVAPAGLTLADLKQVNLFTLDPRRATADRSGIMQRLIDATPLPNDFSVGDGLNTAGFTFFSPRRTKRDQFTIRIDHSFNDKHQLYGIYRHQEETNFGAIFFQTFPGLGQDRLPFEPQSFSGTLVSSLSPTLVNEFRFGLQYAPVGFFPPEEGGLAAVGGKLPTLQNFPISLGTASFSNPINNFEEQYRVAPLFQYTDTLTWTRGDHEFKWGAEIRFIRANSTDTFGVRPSVDLGEAPASQVQLPTDVNPGNSGLARAILYDLTGSIARVDQLYRTPDGKTLIPFQGENFGLRNRQFNFFFRDRWRVKSNLTLIMGLRYEYNTVPFDVHDFLVQPTLGPGRTRFEAALGVSNRTGTYADVFRGDSPIIDPTTIGPVGFELTGPGQRTNLFKDDYNNFSPSLGISWSPNTKLWGLRHLLGGEGKSVLRAGYSIGYEAFPLVLFAQFSRFNPGITTGPFIQPAATPDAVSRLDNPVGVTLPVPLADTRALQPLDLQRRDSGFFIDENLRSPYVQNWNMSWEREIAKDTVLELRYVGTKGTKLVRTANINEINLVENGLAREFALVRQQLLDSGDPFGFTPRAFPAGVTALAQIFRTPARFLGLFGGRDQLLIGDFVQLAFRIDREQIFGAVGAWLSRAGLPVNFISANPEFASVLYMSNYSNSTYHAGQVELRRRFSNGLQFQGNYTFSRALGDGFDDGTDQFGFTVNFRTLRNRSIEKGRLVFDREHVVKLNGIYELPIGPGRRFWNGGPRVIAKMLEGWQLSGIFQAYSGRPRVITAGRFTLYGAGGFNVLPANPAPGFNIRKFAGKVTRLPNGVTFFPGVTNPLDRFGLNRSLVDAKGNVIITTPEGGTGGTLGIGSISDPGEVFFDAGVIKRTNVTETINVEFRAEFFNLFNNVNFTFNPLRGGGGFVSNINSVQFGRLNFQSNDPRIIQLALKVNF
ncbi:MAG: carboxypeptidase-like regulatory domain-containing protein [Acidobacteriota bacterium]|nr:carboxypeptidase-like regulatory domain-containing protein [Blastocatellia bacterium]MDW8238778.1 carboxypeptidase-like regulatory domain-containing protein [Acidobacteriota bacterium]